MDSRRADRRFGSRKDPYGVGLVGNTQDAAAGPGTTCRRSVRRTRGAAARTGIPLQWRPTASPVAYRKPPDGQHTPSTGRTVAVVPVEAPEQHHKVRDNDRRDTVPGQTTPPSSSNLRPSGHVATAARTVIRERHEGQEVVSRHTGAVPAEVAWQGRRVLGPSPVVTSGPLQLQRPVTAPGAVRLAAQATAASCMVAIEAARWSTSVTNPAAEWPELRFQKRRTDRAPTTPVLARTATGLCSAEVGRSPMGSVVAAVVAQRPPARNVAATPRLVP